MRLGDEIHRRSPWSLDDTSRLSGGAALVAVRDLNEVRGSQSEFVASLADLCDVLHVVFRA